MAQLMTAASILMQAPTCWISFWRPTICLNLILLMVSVERVRLPDSATGPEVAARPCVPARLCFRTLRPLALSAWMPPSLLRRGATLYTSTGYTLPFTCRRDAWHETGLMVIASVCHVACPLHYCAGGLRCTRLLGTACLSPADVMHAMRQGLWS